MLAVERARWSGAALGLGADVDADAAPPRARSGSGTKRRGLAPPASASPPTLSLPPLAAGPAHNTDATNAPAGPAMAVAVVTADAVHVTVTLHEGTPITVALSALACAAAVPAQSKPHMPPTNSGASLNNSSNDSNADARVVPMVPAHGLHAYCEHVRVASPPACLMEAEHVWSPLRTAPLPSTTATASALSVCPPSPPTRPR
jgi:hypothetical protein